MMPEHLLTGGARAQLGYRQKSTHPPPTQRPAPPYRMARANPHRTGGRNRAGSLCRGRIYAAGLALPSAPPRRQGTGQNIARLRPSPRGQQQRARKPAKLLPFFAARLGARHATPERPTQALPISPAGARLNRPDFPIPFFPSHFVALCPNMRARAPPQRHNVDTATKGRSGPIRPVP